MDSFWDTRYCLKYRLRAHIAPARKPVPFKNNIPRDSSNHSSQSYAPAIQFQLVVEKSSMDLDGFCCEMSAFVQFLKRIRYGHHR